MLKFEKYMLLKITITKNVRRKVTMWEVKFCFDLQREVNMHLD
jgi:hypothetical protein